MSCYKCGSEEGSSSRLCPECNEERLRSRKGGRPGELSVEGSTEDSILGGEEDRGQPFKISKHTAFQIIAGAGLFLSIFYLLFFSASGPGWGMSPADRVLKVCRDKMNVEKMKSELRNQSQIGKMEAGAGKEFAKAMEGALIEMMGGMGETMCEALAQECRKEPKGQKCRSILSSL